MLKKKKNLKAGKLDAASGPFLHQNSWTPEVALNKSISLFPVSGAS